MRLLRASLVVVSTFGVACSASSDDAHLAQTQEAISFSGIHLLNPIGFQAGWTDAGLAVGGDPAIASWGAGRIDMFARVGNTLVQKVWTSGGGWAPGGDNYWPITTGIAGDPSVVAWRGTNVDVAYHNAAGQLMHTYWQGNGWQTENLDGWSEGRPTISVAPDGTRMDVFARVGHQVWHRAWAGFINAWSPWENLNLYVDGDPVAISWGRGHVDLFSRAANGDTQHFIWDATASGTSAWTVALQGKFAQQAPLGPWAKSAPTVASSGAGNLEVFIQGGDDGIYRKTYSGYTNTWSTWRSLKQCTFGTPAATFSDVLHLVVRDQNNHRVLHNRETEWPSSTPGTTPFCCGASQQQACSVSGCGANLGPDASNKCVQCGYHDTPLCTAEPHCFPGQGVPIDGMCIMSYDNGTALNPVCEGTDKVMYKDQCVHCSLAGEPVCPGNRCSGDHVVPFGDHCQHCGNLDEHSCPTNFSLGRCNTSDLGPRSTDQKCEPCGHANQEVCWNDSYDPYCAKGFKRGAGWSCVVDARPQPDDPNCGKSNWGETAHPCCHNKQACVSGQFCNRYNDCQPNSLPNGTPQACDGGAAPKFLEYCAKCTQYEGGPQTVDYYVYGNYCDDDKAEQMVKDSHPGCDVDEGKCPTP